MTISKKRINKIFSKFSQLQPGRRIKEYSVMKQHYIRSPNHQNHSFIEAIIPHYYTIDDKMLVQLQSGRRMKEDGNNEATVYMKSKLSISSIHCSYYPSLIYNR